MASAVAESSERRVRVSSLCESLGSSGVVIGVVGVAVEPGAAPGPQGYYSAGRRGRDGAPLNVRAVG